MKFARLTLIKVSRKTLLWRGSALVGLGFGGHALAGPFYMGGDVSLLPFEESAGAVYRDGGQVVPADQIMVDHGTNLFRLRLFVNPQTDYNAGAYGAIQDLNWDISLARRLKASGAKFLLDFHYSDTWADPGHQTKPAAWSGFDFPTLNSTLRQYTENALIAFKSAGVTPDMVQVGNEIGNGMLWPDGQVVYGGPNQTQSWMNFGSLVNSAIAGVRDFDALGNPGQHTQIVLHVQGGDSAGYAQSFFTNLTNLSGVTDYDTMAMSFYPASSSAFTNLQGNLNWMVANSAKKVMVAETNYPWEGPATGAGWPSTPTGQHDFFVAVRDAVRNLPNNRGQGVLWWYPEGVQVPNYFVWQGGAIALFDDSGGDALPALNEFQLTAPTWNVNSNGSWSNSGNWSGGVPNGTGQVARFGSAIGAPRTVTLDSPKTVGTITFLSGQSYTIAGSSTLTMDATNDVGVAEIGVLGGCHTISAPVVLADDTEINVGWSNRLTVSGNVSAAGKKITKVGSGTVQFENVRAARLDLQYGLVKISSKTESNDYSGTSVLSNLTIAQGGVASLDLANNALVIDYGGSIGSLEDDLRQHLLAGRIVSSAADQSRRLGYIDNVLSGRASFGGVTVDQTSLLVGYTYAGDTNLDGQVDASDLSNLAQHWAEPSGADWSNGDFNYDGRVDIRDLYLLASDWEDGVENPMLMSVGAPSSFQVSTVPEPTLIRVAGLGLFLHHRPSARRRRSRAELMA